MGGLKRLALPLLATCLLAPGAVQSMDIVQYDQMANQDRQAFLDSLSRDAETVLKQEGRSADAAKVHQLFNDISSGSNLPLGEAELELNLDAARVRDAEKHAQNHDAPRVQAETPLISTLEKNAIKVSPDFIRGLFRLTATFRPKFSPMATPPSFSRTAPPAASRPNSPDDDPIGPGGFITPPRR